MKKLIILFALLLPVIGFSKDKGQEPDYVPIADYVTLVQTYGGATGTLYALFDFETPYVLHSIELRLDTFGAGTTECEGRIFIQELATNTQIDLAKKSWRAAEDTSFLRVEFPAPVLIDPQTQILGLGVQPSGGYCSLTLNGIAAAP